MLCVDGFFFSVEVSLCNIFFFKNFIPFFIVVGSVRGRLFPPGGEKNNTCRKLQMQHVKSATTPPPQSLSDHPRPERPRTKSWISKSLETALNMPVTMKRRIQRQLLHGRSASQINAFETSCTTGDGGEMDRMIMIPSNSHHNPTEGNRLYENECSRTTVMMSEAVRNHSSAIPRTQPLQKGARTGVSPSTSTNGSFALSGGGGTSPAMNFTSSERLVISPSSSSQAQKTSFFDPPRRASVAVLQPWSLTGSSSSTNINPSPDLLRDLPEATHPVILVANSSVKPRDVSCKFLRNFGSKCYDWSHAVNFSCAPFESNNGLSEACMYHCVIEVEVPNLQSPKNPIESIKSIIRRASAVKRNSGNLSHSFSGGNLDQVLDRQLLDGTNNGVASPADPLSSTKYLQKVPAQTLMWVPPPPPPVCVIKHYDTSIVDTPSMLIRVARHLTSTTADKMASHEKFFYEKLAPFFSRDSCPFRVPRVLFIANLQRGEANIFKYVCCGSGSGSTTTIGLEDITKSGFSTAHSEFDGLVDEEQTVAALQGLAHLHSFLWGRTGEVPFFSPLQPAMIIRCVHRVGAGERFLGNLRSVSVRTTCKRWEVYPPTQYLQNALLQDALRFIKAKWGTIRTEGVSTISRHDTLLHGDAHYKNVAFRRWRRCTAGFSVGAATRFASSASVDQLDLAASGGRSPSSQTGGTSTSGFQACFLDFQSCGAGSVAAELLYFVCTSVPVKVDWRRDVLLTSEDTAEQQPSVSPTLHPREKGDTPYISPLIDVQSLNLKAPPSTDSSTIFSVSGCHTLPQIFECDQSLIRAYYDGLSPTVQCQYSMERLTYEFYLLARHWAGCLVADLNSTTIEERIRLKRVPQFHNVLVWAERTSERVMATVASVYSEIDDYHWEDELRAAQVQNTRRASLKE